MLYAVKTPKFLTFLFPNLIWEILDDKKTVYLTFDDGPTEKVTRKIELCIKITNQACDFYHTLCT